MAAPDAVAVQAPNLQSSTFIISRRTENTRIRGVNKNRAAIHNTQQVLLEKCLKVPVADALWYRVN